MIVRPLRRDVHWTSEEDDILREMAGSGESVARIAQQLNRAPGSVRNRALRLNIPLAKSPTRRL
jgi:DNA-binding NarL/FixJ family response regulator